MISVIVPFYNERKGIRELYDRINKAMRELGRPFEIIFVDDGSQDGTFEEIKKLSPVRGLRLRRNFGQTAAFACGIAQAKGDIVVTSDGDLENFPEDMPSLIRKIDEGYDVAAGWRKERWGTQFFTRKLPSVLANGLISRITGIKLHDHGCNLRAYRKQVFDNLYFAGEMHRMLAAYLGMEGAKIAEVPVNYSPRKFGKSKYGLSRTFKVLLDVLASYFFRKYMSRPLHFFGYMGFAGIGFGALTSLWALYLRIFSGVHFNRTPLPELVAIFVVVGFQFILMGILAELLVRTRSDPKAAYDIREQIEN